jgi:hypothetical protein
VEDVPLAPPPPPAAAIIVPNAAVAAEQGGKDVARMEYSKPCLLFQLAFVLFVTIGIFLAGDVRFLEDNESVAVSVVAASSAVAVHTVIPSGAPYPYGGRDNDGELYEFQSNLLMSLAGDVLVHEDELSVAAVAVHTVIPSGALYPCGGRGNDGELYEFQSTNPMVMAGDALVLEDDVGSAVHTVIPQEAPYPRGGRYVDGELYECIRWAASAIAFLVWYFIVLYWTWLQQEPFLTILVTVVGLAVRRHLAERWAIHQKEWYVIRYRTLVYEALYMTHGPIEADVLFARVAARAFPSNRIKRDQLKAKVWKYIVRDANEDYRIEIEQVQGKAIWEWVALAPPAGL